MSAPVRGVPAGITLPDTLIRGKGGAGLAEYAAELTAAHGPGVAYAALKELCLTRATTHGPWAGMPVLLRRLAKAAGADRDVEDDDITEWLVTGRHLLRGPIGIWRAYYDSLVRLLPADADNRHWVAGLDCDLGNTAETGIWWLELLLDSKVAVTVSTFAPQRRADWLSRLINRLSDAGPRSYPASGAVPPRFDELLDQLAPGLADPPSSGTTVDRVVDIRFIERLLARGYSVTPAKRLEWSGWEREPADTRSDLSLLAADPGLAAVLATDVASRLQHRRHETARQYAAVPALRPYVLAWQQPRGEQALRDLASAGLRGLNVPVNELTNLADGGWRAPDGPDVDAVDFGRVLAAALRDGILDEFGWPALEEAVAQLGQQLKVKDAWPELLVSDDRTTLAVSAEGWRAAGPEEFAAAAALTKVEPQSISWPGTDTPRELAGPMWVHYAQFQLSTSDSAVLFKSNVGARPSAASIDLPAAGTPCVPPARYWEYLRVRDAAGSIALRGITEAAAGRLLAAAVADLRTGPDSVAATASAIAAEFPELTHPGLRAGLLGTLRYTAGQWLRFAAATGQEAGNAPLDGGAVISALAHTGLVRRSPERGALAAQLAVVRRFFTADLDDPTLAGDQLRPSGGDLLWPALIGCAGAVARRAVSPTITAQERGALLDLLEYWAGTPFAAEPGAYRVGRARNARNDGAVTATGRWLHVSFADQWWGDAGDWWIATGDAVAGSTVDGQRVMRSYHWPRPWGSSERLRRFTALARERGPLPWAPAIADRLAAATGLGRGAAALLWASFLYAGWAVRRHEPPARLPDSWVAELAELPGVERAELAAGAIVLSEMDTDDLLAALDESVPDDPAQLWEPPGEDGACPAVDGLAAAILARLGRQAPISGQLLAAAPDSGGYSRAELLLTIAHPERSPALTQPARNTVVQSREFYHIAGEQPRFLTDSQLTGLASYLAWAYADLPAGHPVRAGAPRTLALIRERLRDPGLLVDAGRLYRAESDEVDRLITALGAPPPFDAPPPVGSFEHLPILCCRRPPDRWNSNNINVFVHPATVTNDQLAQIRAACYSNNGADGLLRLHADDLTAVVARIEAADLPDGGYEANPALSTPDLVATVAKEHGLPPDAAVLYLQLLGLKHPTDQDVQRWNGWTVARRKKAAAVLDAAGLVVTEKRARARRTVFVPGDWWVRKDVRPREAYKVEFRWPQVLAERFAEAYQRWGG